MSVTIAISYSSLRNAASEAKSVARKLDSYADNLYSSVYNKLNSYNGNYTGNISTAKTRTNSKITELRNKSQAYTNYSNDLSDLKDRCETTDVSVRNMVSMLTATFKSNHGIKNNPIENAVNYFLTGLKNSSPAGRWINNQSDRKDSIKERIKEHIEDWWDYEGGKEFIKGVASGILGAVIGVCGVITGVAAFIAAGTFFGAIAAAAGVILGVIGTVNGVTNVINEGRGYNETKNNNDPALGRRRSDEDSIQDTLRRETDSQFWHDFATELDIAEIVCTGITFVNGVGNLVKNAYKWTTGSMANIDHLRFRDILTKDNFRTFKGKLKMSFKLGSFEIKQAFKLRDFSAVKQMAADFQCDFMNNLKNGFANFEKLTDRAKTISNWSSLSKALISKDFSVDAILIDGLLKKIILPNITLTTLVTYDPPKGSTGGIFDYKDSRITLSDITGKIDSIKGFFDNGEDLGKNWFGNILNMEVLYKLSEQCDFRISVPDIEIPKIHLNAA